MSIQASLEAKALFSSKVLLQQLKSYITNLSSLNNSEELTKFIQAEFFEFSKYYMALGDQEHRNETSLEDKNVNEIYLLHFALTETFKDFLIIHRDVFLQLQISNYKLNEGVATKKMQQNHFDECKTILLKASSLFLETIKK